ncbi:MAG: molybdopterin converting factor small subunit [Flavobacteriales bacterium]
MEILTFGIAFEIIGERRLNYQKDQTLSCADLKIQLIADYPGLSSISSIKLAVDGEYVDDDFLINPQSEVAIIPPVSGG